MEGRRQVELSDYELAMRDWCACAIAGRRSQAYGAFAEPSNGSIETQIFAYAVSGHVLDFDDTFVPGLSHLSAATAPTAVVVASRLSASFNQMMEAYSAGFEAMGTAARSMHPELYEAGWHSTSVLGVVGSAVTAGTLLGLSSSEMSQAMRMAMLFASGLRSSFGSIGKSCQVANAAANGYRAAYIASKGSDLPEGVETGPGGFPDVYGAPREPSVERRHGQRAVEGNWIKAYPCCLQTHSSIEAAISLSGRIDPNQGEGSVWVHPVSRQAAALDAVTSGLGAKFSIPYLTAYALVHGPPDVDAFAAVDGDVAKLSDRIAVRTDASLGVNESYVRWRNPRGVAEARVTDPLGSPGNPMDEKQHVDKVHSLAGDALDVFPELRSEQASTLVSILEEASCRQI